MIPLAKGTNTNNERPVIAYFYLFLEHSLDDYSQRLLRVTLFQARNYTLREKPAKMIRGLDDDPALD
jgi:hypothetical protein